MPEKYIWNKACVQGEKPRHRYFHSMCALHEGALLLFGGKDDVDRFSDLQVFNVDPRVYKWSEPIPAGNAPCARSAHTVNSVGDRVYVFGGHKEGEKFDDIHCLDIRTHEWKKLSPAAPVPSKRNAHTMTSAGKLLYLFGGFDGQSRNDLWTFDTTCDKWTVLEPSGFPPPPRCCHSATLIRNTELWVFAGKNNDSEGVKARYQDVYVLDTISMVWTNPNPSIRGTLPSPRNAHTAVAWKEYLLVFGGFDGDSCNDLFTLDTVELVWREIRSDSVPPSPRYCHTAVMIGNRMFLFGGCDAKTNYRDMLVLECYDEVAARILKDPVAVNNDLMRLQVENHHLEEENRELKAELQKIQQMHIPNREEKKASHQWHSMSETDNSQVEESEREKRQRKRKKKKDGRADSPTTANSVVTPLKLGDVKRQTGPSTVPHRLPILNSDSPHFPPIKGDTRSTVFFSQLIT